MDDAMHEPSPDTAGRPAGGAPVFTVVVTTYHREHQVLAAIASVLADDLPTREVIVIDDAPDRSAEQALRSIGDQRVRYVAMFVDTPVLIYSTGLTSIIHDLHGDTAVIAESNRRAHIRDRGAYGWLEYRSLQVASKLLPIGGAARSTG